MTCVSLLRDIGERAAGRGHVRHDGPDVAACRGKIARCRAACIWCIVCRSRAKEYISTYEKFVVIESGNAESTGIFCNGALGIAIEAGDVKSNITACSGTPESLLSPELSISSPSGIYFTLSRVGRKAGVRADFHQIKKCVKSREKPGRGENSREKPGIAEQPKPVGQRKTEIFDADPRKLFLDNSVSLSH